MITRFRTIFASTVLGCFFLIILFASGCSNSPKVPVRVIKSTFAAWQNLPYVDITNDSNFANYISSTPIRTVEHVSPDQKAMIYSCLVKMFLAYHDGSMEAYMSFRAPRGINWSLDPDAIDNMLEVWSSATNAPALQNEQELWNWFARYTSGGDYYSNFWTGVCLDPGSLTDSLGSAKGPLQYGIRVYKLHRMSTLYEEVQDYASRTNLMWALYYSTMYFREPTTPRKLLQLKHELVVADVFGFIKRKQPYAPQPLLARFYWSSAEHMWVPMDLCVGALNHVYAYKRVRVTMF
jgi:hypothetical protein